MAIDIILTKPYNTIRLSSGYYGGDNMKEPYLLRIPPEVKAKLTAKADEVGISLNSYILQIFYWFLNGGVENARR